MVEMLLKCISSFRFASLSSTFFSVFVVSVFCIGFLCFSTVFLCDACPRFVCHIYIIIIMLRCHKLTVPNRKFQNNLIHAKGVEPSASDYKFPSFTKTPFQILKFYNSSRSEGKNLDSDYNYLLPM